MLPKKKKKVNENINNDSFFKYCLTYTDYKGNPFMYMVGTQIYQNPSFLGLGSAVVEDYRRYINKK